MEWHITVYDGVDTDSEPIKLVTLATQQACIEWLYRYVSAARVEHHERSYNVFLGGQLLRQL